MPISVSRPKPKGGSEPDERLRWTALFMAGLRERIPWGELCRMQLPCLVMMLDSQLPAGGGQASDGIRDATQDDIRALFS